MSIKEEIDHTIQEFAAKRTEQLLAEIGAETRETQRVLRSALLTRDRELAQEEERLIQSRDTKAVKKIQRERRKIAKLIAAIPTLEVEMDVKENGVLAH